MQIKKTVFIVLFAILYICVGLVSTIHAISFFGLANSPVLGTILAITFEIGQAAVLFNLLTSPSQRKKIMPWALMCILTLVQVLGNIFSSYKYLITNSTENLRYFKEPIFTWTDLPDNQCNVIITYIVGAILPIVALCLTEMVVSYLHSDNNVTTEKNDVIDNHSKDIETSINDNKNNVDNTVTTEKNDVMDNPSKDIETSINDNKNNVDNTVTNKTISEDTKEAVDELLSGTVKQSTNNDVYKKSHFININ